MVPQSRIRTTLDLSDRMSVVDTFTFMRSDPKVERLFQLLQTGNTPVFATGMWGSSAPILAALASQTLNRTVLFVTAHADEADNCVDDISTALGTTPEQLPQLESLPSEQRGGDDELLAERLRLCLSLSDHAQRGRDASSPLIVASVHALMQPVPDPQVIAASSLALASGDVRQPEAIVQWLEEQRFTRCDQVGLPGDYAQRGGIIDVFSEGHRDPIRLEFFGDALESIRLFDAGTQRSSQPVESIRIPARQANASSPRDRSTTSFLALLPKDTIIAFLEPLEIQELGRTYWQQLGERAGIIPADAIFRRANDFTQLYLQRFDTGGECSVNLGVESLPQFEPKRGEALQALETLAGECEVVVFCDNAPERQRFEQVLDEHFPQRPRIRSEIGVIQRGFRWRDIAIVPHHEIFSRYRQRRTLRRVQPARPIDSVLRSESPGITSSTCCTGSADFAG